MTRNTMNASVHTDIANSVLCWLATVDPTGVPNVTPKEIFAAYGDRRLNIADIASSNSVTNIRGNPNVCASFVDVFRQKGFKLVGKAEVIPPEDGRFSELGAELLRMAGTMFTVRHVISIEIERISRIWAPSYALFPNRSDDDIMKDAYRLYGVAPME